MQVDDKESSTSDGCSDGPPVYLSMFNMYICIDVCMYVGMYVCSRIYPSTGAGMPWKRALLYGDVLSV